jgi:hypothetical protein
MLLKWLIYFTFGLGLPQMPVRTANLEPAMTKSQTKPKNQKPEAGRRKKPRQGRPRTQGELRTALLAFRTTPVVRELAERLAKAEGRSISNLVERLIQNEYRESLGRAAPHHQAALPAAGVP